MLRFIVLLLAIGASGSAFAEDDAGPEDHVDAGVEVPPDAGVPAAEEAPAEVEPGVVTHVEKERRGRGYVEWDTDGDGAVEPHEAELEERAAEVFADVPTEVVPETLSTRPKHHELAARSLTVARFRTMVEITRKKVLARLTARIEATAARRVATVSKAIAICAMSGVLLLLLPVFLARRYPGQLGLLFRYSALAALTFMLTVGLFGGVALLHRAGHARLAEHTNPQLALAFGFFDTLDDNAAECVRIGKELYAPTLTQLQGSSDQQPASLLIANGRKLVKDASAFESVASAFDRVNVVVGMVPSLLLVLSMAMFLLAIKPTLVAIVTMPAHAASNQGASGADVFQQSLRRAGGELVATLGSLAVLGVISLLAGAALSRVVEPALATLISYFTIAVMYLRFAEDASSTLVLVMLFSVIVFLVMNLAVILFATTFFLAKVHRIFQLRFGEHVPLSTHRQFWRWGSASLVWALVFPWLYMLAARAGIGLINTQIIGATGDAASVNWTALMLAGPLVLIVGFVVALWAGRVFKGLRFLVRYDVQGGSLAAVGLAEHGAALLART